jgi:DNA mismatch repair protein MLH1
MPSRRKAIRSASEEYNRLLDVISKYAIHNSGVAMVCKKVRSLLSSTSGRGQVAQFGGKNPELSTTVDASTKDNIGSIYGESVKRELISLDVPHNEDYGFSAQGWVTGANYSGKKGTFLFFINSGSFLFISILA